MIGGGGTNQHFVYDIATDTGRRRRRCREGAAMASAGAFDGKVFYVGGDDDFSPASGVFDRRVRLRHRLQHVERGTPMPAATSGAGTVQAGEFLYVVGGWGTARRGATSTRRQRYDMRADTWETGPEFTAAKARLRTGRDSRGPATRSPATTTAAASSTPPAYGAPAGPRRLAGWARGRISAIRCHKRSYAPTRPGSAPPPKPAVRSAASAGSPTSSGNRRQLVPRDRRGLRRSLRRPVAVGRSDRGHGRSRGQRHRRGDGRRLGSRGRPAGCLPGRPGRSGATAPCRAVPVTMNVTPPDNWGKVTGTVFGLLRCDEPGSPLAGATVQIGDFVVETDGEGVYEWWLEEGTYPITVTIDGYVTQTGEVTVTAGETTTPDFTCGSTHHAPTSHRRAWSSPCPRAGTDSAELTLTNTGAGAFQFVIDETPFPLGRQDPPAATRRARASRHPPRSASCRCGRSSARGTPDRAAVDAPPWFGGADLPGGLVRYAHAQCDGNTTSTYVFAGWTERSASPTTPGGSTPTATRGTNWRRYPRVGEGPTAVCNAGRIHVLGGDGTDRHYVYDIGNDSWSTAAPVPRNGVGRFGDGAFDGKIYLIGGDSDFFFGGTSDEVSIYDLATDSWSRARPCRSRRPPRATPRVPSTSTS